MLASQVLNNSLATSLAAAKNEVRNAPADVAPRILLFQLLAVLGDWQRSLEQLQVCANLDAGTLAVVNAYREVITGEKERSEVFAGHRTPLLLTETAAWTNDLVRANQLNAAGKHAEAQLLRDQAYQAAPTVAGTIHTDRNQAPQSFEWIADADSRLGPMLEAIINGRYHWVTWDAVRALHVTEPHDLRDVVWTPVYFEWTNGEEGPGFIPTRYHGSENADDALRLSRKTEWSSLGDQSYAGVGQRIFTTDQAEYALMTIRKIQISQLS